MKALKFLSLAAALVALGSLGTNTGAEASTYSHRQYYSGWHHYKPSNYYYRYYYYKPTPQYYGYKYHYTLYYPQTRPKHYYYYNHYNKKFYGRCPTDHGGKPIYSWLKPEHQADQITKIDEKNFPEPDGVKTPPIPESNKANEVNGQEVTMDLPPGEPPGDAVGLPVGN
jgi:hypothetical protein